MVALYSIAIFIILGLCLASSLCVSGLLCYMCYQMGRKSALIHNKRVSCTRPNALQEQEEEEERVLTSVTLTNRPIHTVTTVMFLDNNNNSQQCTTNNTTALQTNV